MVRRHSNKPAYTSALTETPVPPLPEAQTVFVRDGHCIIEYVEAGPRTPTRAPITIVLIHGAPGSLNDFRYLLPLLSHRARVIAVNAPGYGGSKAVNVTKRQAFNQIGGAAAALAVSEAVALLCRDDANVFILGHSFGGHMAITVTKLLGDQSFPVRGLALITPMGHKPNKTLQPRSMRVLRRMIVADVPVCSKAVEALTKQLMCAFVGFSRRLPRSFFVATTIRVATADFDSVMRDLATLSNVPTFHAWSRSDHHIEEDISLTLNEIIPSAGPRIAFRGGGHNLQKTRATALAVEVAQWMDGVLNGHCVKKETALRVLE